MPLLRFLPLGQRLLGDVECLGNGIRGRGTPMGYRRQRVSREARRLLYREGITTGVYH